MEILIGQNRHYMAGGMTMRLPFFGSVSVCPPGRQMRRSGDFAPLPGTHLLSFLGILKSTESLKVHFLHFLHYGYSRSLKLEFSLIERILSIVCIIEKCMF